jgi:Amt family ammonium transporter
LATLIGSGNWTFLWKGGFALTDLGGIGKNAALGAPTAAFFLYMYAFMDTTATIPTGALAERWKWKSFMVWAVFCGDLLPALRRLDVGRCWLAKLGDSMISGSGTWTSPAPASCTPWAASRAWPGPRTRRPARKVRPRRKPRTLAAHNIPMAITGVFILLFGWFGFNAASTLAATDVRFAMVATNTAISAGFGAVAGDLGIPAAGKPDPGMMANGMLAGLVAITAPCGSCSRGRRR